MTMRLGHHQTSMVIHGFSRQIATHSRWHALRKCALVNWKRVRRLLFHSFSVSGTDWVFEEGTMDKSKFDDLARALAQGTSRRDVLRGMLVGVTAGAVAAAATVLRRNRTESEDSVS